MKTIKRIAIVFISSMMLVSLLGIGIQPAYAAVCNRYHIVRSGETLSWIGRYYGVSWVYLAQINHISAPYIIYPGQSLCISLSGSAPYSPYGWSYSVVKVVQNTSVTIRTYNFPDNVSFEVHIGRLSGGAYEWKKVADLDSDRGGSFKATFNLPPEFSGTTKLVIRLTQTKKGISVDRWFNNVPYGSGTGGLYPPTYYGIPTIWIVSVVRDATVTIRTHNFPPGLTFDVLMGPMGTRGIGGYYVGSFNSGAGGTMEVTFNIPPQLYGSYRIAIRTQNLATGYYSYNWFYNNTTY